MVGFATIGDELHADPEFGKTCVVTIPESAAVPTTARAVSSQATDPQTRARRTDRLSCFCYLLVSVFAARPPKGTVITIASGTPYAGTWRTVEAGEPTTHGEWRCPAVIDTTTHLNAAAIGNPRPPNL